MAEDTQTQYADERELKDTIGVFIKAGLPDDAIVKLIRQYNDLSGQATKGLKQIPDTNKELLALMADMAKAGKSDDDIAGFLQKYNDVQHPIRAAMRGAGEGMVSGVVNGVIGLPMMVRDAVMDTIDVLQGEEPKHAKAFLDGLHDLLPTLKDAGPREQARMVADLVTSVGIGVGEGRIATSKPVIRGVGRGLEYAGEHPFAARMTGAAGVVGGISRGDPAMVAGGVAGMMAPPLLSGLGKRLIRVAGDVPRDEQALQSQFANTVRSELNRNVQGAVRLGDKTLRGKLEDLDRNIATTERDASNTRQLAKIQDAAAGMQEGRPSISRSVSATTPSGERMSMSVKLKPAGESVDPVDDLTRQIKRGNPGITDADARKLAERLSAVAPSPVAGAARPTINPTGQAAADLASSTPPALPSASSTTPAQGAVRMTPLPVWKPAADTARAYAEKAPTGSLGEFMKKVDEALSGTPSKSKSASGGWRNLSDNDAITAANAYSSGVRNPDDVIQAILVKRKNRQTIHIDEHYANKREVPEN